MSNLTTSIFLRELFPKVPNNSIDVENVQKYEKKYEMGRHKDTGSVQVENLEKPSKVFCNVSKSVKNYKLPHFLKIFCRQFFAKIMNPFR